MYLDPRRPIALMVLGLLLLVPQARAADPVAVCTATKLQRAGEFHLCFLKDAARIIRGRASQLAKCEAKFAAAWSKAEAKAGGACRTNGDEAALRAQLVGQVAAVFVALNPPVSTTTTTTTLPSGPPCGGGIWPGCGGSCPAGSSCWATVTPEPASGCTCLPAVSTPCADSGGVAIGATCGGACPAGEVCSTLDIEESTFNTTCGCVPAGSTPCISSGQPACGGSCSTGLSCGAGILFPCLCG